MQPELRRNALDFGRPTMPRMRIVSAGRMLRLIWSRSAGVGVNVCKVLRSNENRMRRNAQIWGEIFRRATILQNAHAPLASGLSACAWTKVERARSTAMM